MVKKLTAFAAAAALYAGIAGPAGADEFRATYGAWSVFTDRPTKAGLCYMAAAPDKAEGKYKKRGDIYVLITHRPGDKNFDVFNVAAGYVFKENSTVTATIDKKPPFELFTAGEEAWARDTKTDAALVKALRAGSTLIVAGQSGRGTKTTDTYSLKGFTAAHKAINKACGR